MKRTIIILFLLVGITRLANAQILVGDANNDGELNVSDVTAVVSMILGNEPKRYIDPFVENNSLLSGTWYKTKNDSITFGTDGSLDWPDLDRFSYYPLLNYIFFHSSNITVNAWKVVAFSNDSLIVNPMGVSSVFLYTRQKPIQQVTKITLNVSSFSMNPLDKQQIEAVVYPEDADNKNLEWSSSDENVAVVVDGLVEAKASGTAIITCMSTDESDIYATCEVHVNTLVNNISISESNLSLIAGNTFQLTATVSPSDADNPSVMWQSSDENVATVVDGNVTAIHSGNAIITCSAEDGSGINATCNVTVISLVERITLDLSNIVLKQGLTQRITATVEPADANNSAVVWSSSNENVAVVENGLVRAVAPGSAVIECMSTDGTNVSAYCNVTVEEPVLVTSISLNYSYLLLTPNYDSRRLSMVVYPSNADNKKVSWSSSNSEVATVNDGVVTTGVKGSATITCSATDGSGVTATCLIRVGNWDRSFVDLGLSSGTLWANCNIGAELPEEYGDYFEWGEVSPRDNTYGEWSSYKYCKGSQFSFTKYCYNTEYGYEGFTDELTELTTSDDAAYVNWGRDWRTPSDSQFTELRQECLWTWTSRNGIDGYLVESRTNNNSIFLPANGLMSTHLRNEGWGYYWARTLHTFNPTGAYGLVFMSGYVDKQNGSDRMVGQAIRAVISN